MDTLTQIRNRAAATDVYSNNNNFRILCLILFIVAFFGLAGVSIIDRNVNDFSSILTFYGLHILNICRALIGA